MRRFPFGDWSAISPAWRALLLGAALFLIIICVVVALRADSTSDFRDYWETARHYRETGGITDEHGVHNYLPFFPIFMVPWSYLPLQVAIVLFSVLSLGLLALTVVLAEGLLAGRLEPQPRGALLLTIGLMLPYIVSSSVLGTVNILVLFLIVAAWYLAEQGRDWAAGVPLGLAVLVKVVPAALVVFFLLKRRWRVAGAAAGVIMVLGAGLPIVALGPQDAVAAHRAFYESAIQKHSAYQTTTAEKPIKAKYNNNALPIVLRRLLTPLDANAGPPEEAFFVNFTSLPRQAVWWLCLVILVALFTASAASALRTGSAWPPPDVAGVERLRASFGAWCCLMLLVSPLVWTHHFVWAYWPIAVLSDRAEVTRLERGRPCRRAVVGLVAWLLGAAALAWPAARAVGAQWFALAIVWLVLISLSWPPRRMAEAPRLQILR